MLTTLLINSAKISAAPNSNLGIGKVFKGATVVFEHNRKQLDIME